MIHDSEALRTLLEEISEWSLVKRRQYLADMRKAFGIAAEEQIKQGLADLWAERKRKLSAAQAR